MTARILFTSGAYFAFAWGAWRSRGTCSSHIAQAEALRDGLSKPRGQLTILLVEALRERERPILNHHSSRMHAHKGRPAGRSNTPPSGGRSRVQPQVPDATVIRSCRDPVPSQTASFRREVTDRPG